MSKIFPIDFEEKTTIAQDDYILFSDSEDGNKIKKAQYSNLKGEKGDTGATGSTGPQGPSGTVTVGTTTTGAEGTSASVTNTGTSTAAVLNFTIPKGDKGDTGDTGATGAAATISAGTTTTGAAGTNASVTNVGTSSAAVFNFTIPRGDKGATGSTGPAGNGIASITSSKAGKTTTVTITETNGDVDTFTVQDGADGEGAGDVVGPASSTDGHIAVFDGATGKIIKDGGAMPSVIDNLTSTSTTDALSAAQGKALDDKIADMMGLGKFLSLWDATTGLPDSFPLETPYTYTTGDYFLVETVSSATPPVNYRPTGSSYNGTASSTTESDELEAGDVYIYDGSVWLLQSNHGKTVSFSNIAGQPTDNTNLSNALANKQIIYANCTTAFNTQIKECTTAYGNYSPVAGDVICIVFTQGCGVGSPKFSFDGGDQKIACTVGTGPANAATLWLGMSLVAWLFVYDGTTLRSFPVQNTTYSAGTGISISSGTVSNTAGFTPDNAGSTDQVLTKTAAGYEWATPSGGDVTVSTETGNILSSGTKLWAGTESDYENLGVRDSNTIYLTVE